MGGDIMGYRIIQKEDDNSVVVLKNDKPYIRASLTRPLTKFQMAGYLLQGSTLLRGHLMPARLTLCFRGPHSSVVT